TAIARHRKAPLNTSGEQVLVTQGQCLTCNPLVTMASAKALGTRMPPIATMVALADPTRCRIVEILRDGPQPVHVLAASFDITRPAISRHLRVLKQARLI